ncbi:MAG: sulfite exporter TauE/SafE family protein [Pseudomonadota bacterium]
MSHVCVIELFVLLTIGLLAGLLAGLFGIGGGLVIVPALVWWLRAQGAPLEWAMPIAVASALGSMLLTSASSAFAHARKQHLDWSTTLRLAASLALGALLGAWLAVRLPGQWLAWIFALFAAWVGVRMLLGSVEQRHVKRPAKARYWWLFGPLMGAASAMVGIGGASFNVPYLTRNGFTTLQAVAVAAACGWLLALAGSVGFLLQDAAGMAWPRTIGYWYWPAVLTIGLGGLLMAPVGAALAHRLGSARLARGFGAVLLLVAVRMAMQ